MAEPGPYTQLFREVFQLFRRYATAPACDFDALAKDSAALYRKYEGTPQQALCVDLLAAVGDELERTKGGE